MKITIPKPCHENWEAMTPAEKGRFCSVCSKTVRDFTVASDEEIINAFTNSTEEICGTFQESQLNRNLQYSYINSTFVKFTVGFILTTGGLVSVGAQQNGIANTLKAEPLEEVVMTIAIKKTYKNEVTGGAMMVVIEEKLNNNQENATKKLQGELGKAAVNSDRDNDTKISKIRIGGTRSLQENKDPICILDGKIINIEEFRKIDTDRIETVSTLNKDQLSESIFCNLNAENGIIVITTKNSKKRRYKK